MKVLLITWACDRDDVSEPQIAYRWVKEIAQRHDVVLFSVSKPERFGCVHEQFPDIPVIEWCDIQVPKFLERFRAIVKPGYFFYFEKARRLIKKLILEHNIEIIHHLNPFAWRYASPAYGLGVPLVRGPIAGGLPTPKPFRKEVREIIHPYKFLRFTDELRKKYDRNLRNSYQKTDYVLMAAPYVVEILRPLHINNYMVEIEHGLDKQACASLSKKRWHEGHKIKILYVGRIIRTKGVQEAIHAINYMNNKKRVEFLIIGDGDDSSSCTNLIKKLHLQDNIFQYGWISQEKLVHYYQSSDIFLFPSFREPTGGVLLEAMSFGLPCICSNYGGPKYMVNDNCGLKIPLATPDNYSKQIAHALDFLVDNEKIRLSMGQCAVQHANDFYNWSQKISRISNIYSKLTNGKHKI